MDRCDFLDRLATESNIIDVIKELKEDNLPIYIWGCGQVAEDIYYYLDRLNIEIVAAMVDKEYLSIWKEKKLCGKLEVFDKDSVRAHCKKFNVIVGHSRYELGKAFAKEMPEINRMVYLPSVSYNQFEKTSREEINKNVDRYIELIDVLEDEKSVNSLFAFLNTKITGDISYILDVFERPMTFFDNDLFCASENEVYMDIGAYDGDTIKIFLDASNGKYKKIIALEPDLKNYEKLSNFVKNNKMNDVVLTTKGAWNTSTVLKFYEGNEQISSVVVDDRNIINNNNSVVKIEVGRLDEMFGNENVTMMKINYLDGVIEALEGAKNIIIKERPKIVSTVGFNVTNILKIVEYLHSLKLDYKFYLRFNSAMTSRLVLYTI